ncbi:MAG TPA: capsule assembly Wzi family protein, partial [Patescibacteria group bacterium]|nr:capsule assembly Wzi family protein [Patescibacteria group bacterium]
MLLLLSAGFVRRAAASTYVVYIPLDSAIYTELDTLNSLGLLETYLQEVRPIARVEAARLTLEAERMMGDAEHSGPSPALPLAKEMVEDLRAELAEEIHWLENDAEDDQPTMVVPVERIEAQYVYSTGQRRDFGPTDQVGEQLHAVEATPLLPNNDDLPTSVSNNEVVRTSAWLGIDKFFTAYGEGAMAGPLTRAPAGVNGSTRGRFSLLRAEAVVDFGNAAVSFGEHEMYWGTGYYGALSQGDNARPFPAVRIANVHPAYLPGFLRYLGPFRSEAFFGQLDHYRPFDTPPAATSSSYPYPRLSGQIIVFKPLSTFEFGITHVIMFGGQNN